MKKRFILAPSGTLADWLLCTPAIKALKDAYPQSEVILYASRNAYKGMRDVMANNPSVDAVINRHWRALLRHPYHVYLFLKGLHKAKDFKTRRIELKEASYYKLHYFHVPASHLYQKNIKDIIPEILGLPAAGGKVLLYFTQEEDMKAKALLEPYGQTVILHTFSGQSYNQAWSRGNWAALVRSMPHLTFIQVGNPGAPPVEGALDWRRLGIRQTLCLIRHATSFVGVSSGYSHATNAFGTPGVVLFGDTSPVNWGHDNNINIYKDYVCAPCQDRLHGNRCPYGRECMEDITVEEVRAALEQQVNRAIPVLPKRVRPANEKIFTAQHLQDSMSIEPGLFFL